MLPAHPPRPRGAAPESGASPAGPAPDADLNALLDTQPEPWSGAGWTREEVCAYREAGRKAQRTGSIPGADRVAERCSDPYRSPDEAVRRALVTLLRSAPRDGTLLRDLARGWRESLTAARTVPRVGPGDHVSG